MTVQSYLRQLNILTNQITTPGMYMIWIPIDLCGSLLIDWSVENMNPHMTSYRCKLDVSVSPKKRFKKVTTNM
jgi:hypothetical protein